MMAATKSTYPEFAKGIRGELLLDESLGRYISWRVGGRADYLYTPADEQDLVLMLSRLPQDYPVYWVGLGSNLLVRDGGVRGMVIRTSKGLDRMSVEGSELFAEAGVSCAKISRYTVRQGYSGAEFLAGVPGTFGGALAMNAGAFGSETWERVKSIRWCDRSGYITETNANEVVWGYRRVELPKNCGILSAILSLDSSENIEGGRTKIRNLLEKRGASQPIQTANAGSVFRNPNGDYAARLLEACGMKGVAVGDAEYSTKHANFIVNRGRASADDIETLILKGQQAVEAAFNVRLEPEVRIIGESL